jgi:diaminopimelate epimerase
MTNSLPLTPTLSRKGRGGKNISFLKMNALGNDFIIIDQRKSSIKLTSKDIIKLSNRKIIGCDQLILILDDQSKEADCYIEIYNSDGSKSPSCGNATRCVAALLIEEKNQERVKIRTDAGILECCKDDNLISVLMGHPKFLWSEIPINKNIATDNVVFDNYRFYLANIGNPHAVTFLTHELSDQEFFYLGKKIESDPLFSLKTNVEFARIINDDLIDVRVFERGVGETLACGTGACAVAAIAIKNNLVKQNEITIRFKGGDLKIKWPSPNSEIIMIGSHQKTFVGNINLADL